jgi:reductive dehalogenase
LSKHEEKNMSEESEPKKKDSNPLSRRDFLRAALVASAGLGVAGAAGAGYVNGKDYDTYTGNTIFHGEGQFFDRKPFEVNSPTYEIVGETRPIDYTTEFLMGRYGALGALLTPGADGSAPQWTPDMGIEALPEPLRSYFLADPKKLEQFFKGAELAAKQAADWHLYRDQFFIADIWSHAQEIAWSAEAPNPWPPDPVGPPEEWDFRNINPEPKQFKSEEHASELMKIVAYSFGATMVGICKFNPDFHWAGGIRGANDRKTVPDHWKYAIVFGVPHEWDMLYSNPQYGTTYDAYSRLRQIGGKLDSFIRQLGYPSRMEIPPLAYEASMPPLAIDAGLGEQGRHGLCITPETGANTRLACVLTNIALKTDKPINFGVQEFCKNCKICAQQCPNNAISLEDEPGVVRGYKRWLIDDGACLNIWQSVATSHPRGCRVCIASCPYSKKDNWLHDLSRTMVTRDPSGVSRTALHWMAKDWYEYPKPEDYLPPTNKPYREPPDWLKSEEWFNS